MKVLFSIFFLLILFYSIKLLITLFISNLFRVGHDNDRDMINKKFPIERCEFWEENVSPKDISVLYYNADLIGIASFYKTDVEPLFYINFRCTVPDFFKNSDDDKNFFKKFLSPGRLLWVYILNHIYELNNKNRNFIVYNHAIPEAYGYHIKMGMKPLSKQNHINKKVMKELFIKNEEINTSKLPEEEIKNEDPYDPTSVINEEFTLAGVPKELEEERRNFTVPNPSLDRFDNTYLFYHSDPNIDYSNLFEILSSLPNAKDRLDKDKKEEDFSNFLQMIENQDLKRKSELISKSKLYPIKYTK